MFKIEYKEFFIHCDTAEDAANFFLRVVGQNLQPTAKLKEAIGETGSPSSAGTLRLSSETKERILKALRQGLSAPMVAQQLGIKVGTIYYLKAASKKNGHLPTAATPGQTPDLPPTTSS